MAAIQEGSLLRSLQGYVSAAVGCPLDRITAASRFENGNRHDVYKVSYIDPTGATEDLVVRVSYAGGSVDCAQAEREARVLRKAGGIAAPLLYDFRCSSPWFETPTMCMQFVPGQQKDLMSATPTEIERLGSVVAWVHSLPVDDLVDGRSEPGNLVSYAEGRLESIISTIAWARDPLPAAIQARLRSAANSVQRSWEKTRDDQSFNTGTPLALLHGDPGPGNVLWGPGPVLIDWEYTRLGDPADEVAFLLDQNDLSPEQRGAFWRGYRAGVITQAPLDHVTDRVDWWEPVTLLGSALWWAERWVRRCLSDAASTVDPGVQRNPGYYADHVIRRLDRLERMLDRP
ncbi:MAG TPA: aminoglycoside phosphotransferase family protein [Acidimicrobiales bacterium]|nr:aminoglycoside phosphotransferase family protein [Acidimicrobiales bacterium]